MCHSLMCLFGTLEERAELAQLVVELHEELAACARFSPVGPGPLTPRERAAAECKAEGEAMLVVVHHQLQ